MDNELGILLRDAKARVSLEYDEAATAVQKRRQRDAILQVGSSHDDVAPATATAAVLIILNVTLESDPLQSWTFPATTAQWDEIERCDEKHRGARVDAALRTDLSGRSASRVVVSSSHTSKACVVHAELLRHTMLAVHEAHCVTDGTNLRHSKTFWREWAPEPSARANAAWRNDIAVPTQHVDASGIGFPGELVTSLSSLVPPQVAIRRAQSMYAL